MCVLLHFIAFNMRIFEYLQLGIIANANFAFVPFFLEDAFFRFGWCKGHTLQRLLVCLFVDSAAVFPVSVMWQPEVDYCLFDAISMNSNLNLNV